MTSTQKQLSTASFLLISFLLSFSFVHAQSDPILIAPDPNATVDITMDPANPAPGDTVHLVVTGGSLVSLQDSSITWFRNGKSVSKGIGNTSFDVKIGSLGQETDVDVQVVSSDGVNAMHSISIIPTHIDLLVDSTSYTPPFYKGRALPSAGTQLHVQALTYFKRPDGSSIPSSSIIYTWRRNGEVIGSISGKGRHTVTMASPVLHGTDTISVDAASSDGLLSGSASMRLSSTEPVLTLYKDHPLFGLMYYQAMGNQTSIPDSEMTFAAVPYFAQIQNPDDSRLQYTWTVNGTSVPMNATHPSEVTINADKSAGKATIELSLSHLANFFMSPKGTWGVSFKAAGQIDNPFSNNF